MDHPVSAPPATRSRYACLGLGVVLIGFGVWIPQTWYDPLPQYEELPPPPLSGFLLLRLSLALEGIVLLWAGVGRWTLATLPEAERLTVPGATIEPSEHQGRHLWLLAAVTLLGLVLRVIALDSDLWLDEISPILAYQHVSAWQVLISYISSNNHLLNTLLVKLCVGVFGEHAWAIRLPAVVFGTATVPALYWVARQVMSGRASLCAALLLAVSYHHVFFSQDARGYTAYLFFALVSSALLVKGLREDRAWVWIAYVLSTVLNFASILISGFVFAAHLLVAALAVRQIRRQGRPALPLFKRLLGVFGVTALLGFQLYAAVLPQIYVYTRTIYADPAAGFALFARGFLLEIARGLSVGFATGLLFGAIPFLLIAAMGYGALFRRNWALMTALTAPGVLQVLFVAAGGLVVSPRFFLLALPLAALVAVRGIDHLGALAARRLKRESGLASRVSAGSVTALTLSSLASLPGYYTVPKQAYRSSLEYVEAARRPDGFVMVIHLAEGGYRYYGRRAGIQEGRDYFYVRSVTAFETLLARNRGRRSWLVLTFPRALRLSLPDLDTRIREGWVVAQVFPGTIGDGDITVWRQRQP
jgi:hypothetical protein